MSHPIAWCHGTVRIKAFFSCWLECNINTVGGKCSQAVLLHHLTNTCDGGEGQPFCPPRESRANCAVLGSQPWMALLWEGILNLPVLNKVIWCLWSPNKACVFLDWLKSPDLTWCSSSKSIIQPVIISPSVTPTVRKGQITYMKSSHEDYSCKHSWLEKWSTGSATFQQYFQCHGPRATH